MNQKTRHNKRLLLTISGSLVFLIMCGCGSKAEFTQYMHPELLYLKEQPYSHLYVEVDSVEGVEVPDEWLNVLKEFLAARCSKPDGIRIVIDEPIAYDDIKDMPIGPASLLCIDGPDPNSGPQPAYLHVFFYNKKKIFKKAVKNPFVTMNCPTTIFYNADYGYRLDTLIKFTLTHEAGHILGLCINESHSDGSHCTNKGCLMRESAGYLESLWFLLFGVPLKSNLCEECASDLAHYKSQSADPNLAFDGPFLIRRENGYSVATLPYCIMLIPQALENEFDWHDILASIKEQCRDNKDRYDVKGILILKSEDGSKPDMNLYRDTLVKASDDLDLQVRHYAAEELERLEQDQR